MMRALAPPYPALVLAFMMALIMALMMTATANAKENTPLENGKNFKKWQFFTTGEGQDKICTIRTAPTKSSPDNVRRGGIYASVSHRPAQFVFSELAVHVGYPFSAISNPFTEIEGRAFNFFSGVAAQNGADEWAWLHDLRQTPDIITAMKAAHTMTFKGTSARGTLTEDTYSLLGFTAAHAALNRACPRL